MAQGAGALMTLRSQQNPRPGRLSDVLRQVRDAFACMGDATPIMCGKKYLENLGEGPRVLFVPNTDGRIEGPLNEDGTDAASALDGCMCLIRAKEGGDDFSRFDPAYDLRDRVIGCLAVAASGRIEWGSYGDGSPLDVDAYGAELIFSFTFKQAIPHLDERWALPPAAATTEPPRPLTPPGDPGEVEEFVPSVQVSFG